LLRLGILRGFHRGPYTGDVTPVEPYFCVSRMVPSTTYGSRYVLRPALGRFAAVLFHVWDRGEGEDIRGHRAYVLLGASVIITDWTYKLVH
jgi:hypothetical protein